MRFLVDAQLPPALARWLTAQRHDAVHLSDIGLLAAPDALIVAHAEREGRVIVGKDEDFVSLRLPDRFGLVWLRIGNATTRTLLAWIEPRWPAIERLLEAGERLVEVR